jgi:hypothetical protein
MPAGAVTAPARSHHVQNGRADVGRTCDAGGVAPTRAATGAHSGGTTAQRSDRIRRSAGIERHHGGDQPSVHPTQAGERAQMAR